MKIEIGESLMLSWLRHVKHCQSVQLNWKASMNSWELSNEEKIIEIMQKTRNHFDRLFGYDIFKKTSSHLQFLLQGEIDVLGLQVKKGMISNIYGVDIAFHEGGLSYGGGAETSERVVKKMIRTAMLIIGFFDMTGGDIVFASPKIHKSVFVPLSAAVKELNSFFQQLGYHFNFILYANHQFRGNVFEPVINLSKSVAVTSELFLRSIQMYNMFSSETVFGKDSVIGTQPEVNTMAPAEIAATLEPPAKQLTLEDSMEIKIGTFVRQEIKRLIVQNLLSPEKIEHLTDKKHCKNTFDINYPFLKKVTSTPSLQEQRMVNGYPRYWSQVYIIKGQKYFLCNDWYDRNTTKFLTWLDGIK